MKITGTFLDEISHDIPSANWGPEEWAKDFDSMKEVGIDTVILIRAGYKDKAVFNSEALSTARDMRPAYIDLVDLFLSEAERTGMKFYFGLYDSGQYWHQGDFQKEIDINLALADEVNAKYGDRKAFAGWYMSHELHVYNDAQLKVYDGLAERLRGLCGDAILMSPFVKGRMQFDDPVTPEEHEKMWDKIFSQLAGKIDVVAFQDGQVDFNELAEFTAINKSLADKYGITSWANVESFERGMPMDFLPIAWNNLRYKMEIAAETGIDKLITFEFSHFMSPNSMYPSAHNLFKRYREWLAAQ